jgi:hypothetical protein
MRKARFDSTVAIDVQLIGSTELDVDLEMSSQVGGQN